MKSKRKLLIFIFACAPFLRVQISEARISSLSPWTFQERLATPKGAVDQSVGFQVGFNGITPTGGNTDSTFLLFPYQLTYGVYDKVEVGASWGLEYVGRKNQSNQFGINDLSVAARYRFFDPSRTKRDPGLDFEFGLSFPTASFEKGLGTGAVGILFGWGLVLPLDPVRMHVGMGYRLNTENSDDVRLGHVFSYNAGASYPLKLRNVKEPLTLLGEIKGFNRSRNKFRGENAGPQSDELYLAPGAAWKFAVGGRYPYPFRLLGQLLIGLTSDSSDVGFSFELQF